MVNITASNITASPPMIVATVVEQVYAKMNRAEFACSPFITIDVYIEGRHIIIRAM